MSNDSVIIDTKGIDTAPVLINIKKYKCKKHGVHNHVIRSNKEKAICLRCLADLVGEMEEV